MTTQELRDLLNISQAHLAMLVGVHSMTVSKWERGLLTPKGLQAELLKAFRPAARHDEAALIGHNAVVISKDGGTTRGIHYLLSFNYPNDHKP